MPTGRAIHVLYVDDYAPMSEIVTESLEQEGFRVTACLDGLAALAVMSDTGQAIDIAVIDYNLPGMQGDELARRIRALAALPVVIVSGYVNARLQDLASASGALRVIDKATLYDGLAGLLRELIQQGTGQPAPPCNPTKP